MKVREATCADAAALAHVHVDSWRESYQSILPADYLAGLSYDRYQTGWNQRLCVTPDAQFVYVVEDEAGQIVGFASGGPQREQNPPNFPGELYAIYLRDVAKGKNIGPQLFTAIVDRLISAGLTPFCLWVFKDNPRARRFYERMGGIEVGQNTFSIGGVTLDEVAYGWSNINHIPH